MRRVHLLLLALAAAFWNGARAFEDRQYLSSHSVYAPYVRGSDLAVPNYAYDGDVVIDTARGIRLTNDKQSQSGRLWSHVPLDLPHGWIVDFDFNVHGKSSLFGDGFAFFFTKSIGTVGPVFGSSDKFEGLGIFFDTFPNSRHSYSFPYVSAMIGDGKTAYDKHHDNEATQLQGAGCEGHYRGKDKPTKARVKYYDNHVLSLEMAYDGSENYEQCFLVENVKLPSQGYIGFSAETGDVHDTHEIVSVSASALKEKFPAKASSSSHDNAATSSSPLRSSSSSYTDNSNASQGGSSLWFYVKFLFFAVLCAVGFIGFQMYSKNQQSYKKF